MLPLVVGYSYQWDLSEQVQLNLDPVVLIVRL